mgnify:CR=1 FL=1
MNKNVLKLSGTEACWPYLTTGLDPLGYINGATFNNFNFQNQLTSPFSVATNAFVLRNDLSSAFLNVERNSATIMLSGTKNSIEKHGLTSGFACGSSTINKITGSLGTGDGVYTPLTTESLIQGNFGSATSVVSTAGYGMNITASTHANVIVTYGNVGVNNVGIASTMYGTANINSVACSSIYKPQNSFFATTGSALNEFTFGGGTKSCYTPITNNYITGIGTGSLVASNLGVVTDPLDKNIFCGGSINLGFDKYATLNNIFATPNNYLSATSYVNEKAGIGVFSGVGSTVTGWYENKKDSLGYGLINTAATAQNIFLKANEEVWNCIEQIRDKYKGETTVVINFFITINGNITGKYAQIGDIIN